MSECKLTDNSKDVEKELNKKVGLCLELLGQKAEEYAKLDCPVDTGRLRNSITYATSKYSGVGSYADNEGKSYSDAKSKANPESDSVYIGTNVNYAPYIEFKDSNHKSGKAHFLRDAIVNHKDSYESIVKATLKQ